jgi:uncharacterized membrane protein YphA (DoxX/SURF4 family)
VRLPGLVLQGILARAALVFLRLYLGFAFLFSAWLKFQDGASQPDASFMAAAMTWGGLLVGITLVLGLLTRFSATVALLLSVSYLRSTGAWLDATGSGYAAHAAMSLALLVGAAGRTMGLDAVLARRWPRSPLW